MAKARGRNNVLMLMVAVVLLIAMPALVTESQETPAPPAAPPGLDTFLTSVRRTTGPTARLLIIGNPSDLVFQRSTYWLYPRVLSTLPMSEWVHILRTNSLDWNSLRAMARRRGAHYVLLWGFPLDSHVKARLTFATGHLVEVLA